MSKSTIGLRRKGLAALATTTLTMGAVFAGAGIASADEDFTFERVAGQDRYETSAEIAADFGASTDAILASGEDGRYPDALSANYLAGLLDAPILLTETEELPADVLAQLKANGVDDVTIVGGELAVSAAVEAELVAEGFNVTREAGRTRFDTNEAIIEEGGDAPSNVGLVTTGLNFPDALSVGPLAYKGGHPVGLSNGGDMPDATIDAMKAAGVDQALVVGGPIAVPESVITELENKGIEVLERLARTEAGQTNRSGTAAAVARYAVANLGFSTTGVNVASGRAFGDGADALAGGPLSGEQNRPILITENESIAGAATLNYLRDFACTLTDGIIFGGPLAITPALEGQLQAAARDCEGNQDFTVDQSAATNEFSTSGTGTATDNRGRRTYSFSGLDDTKTYDIAVFPAEYVTVSGSGLATFRDTEGTTSTTDDNNVADWAETEAVIERINNADYTDAPTNGTTVTAQAPVNGVITVTLDSEAADEVRPVLYLDADNGSTETAPDLDLDANNEPSEMFAVGGQKSWIAPQAAASGDAADGRVESLSKASNEIGVDTDESATVGDYNAAGVDVRYIYDGNDNFSIDDAPATMEEFEAALSRGDGIEVGRYSQNSALVSDFNLVDGPTAPATVTADKGAAGSENDITVVVDFGTPTTDAQYDSVVIQRAPVAGGTQGGTEAPGTYTTVATVPVSEDEDSSTATFTWTDENVAVGAYNYRAAGVVDGDQGPFKADATNETSTAPSADTTGPNAVANSAVIDRDLGFTDVPTTGDVYRVYFNEAIVLDNPALRVADGDGDTDTIDSSNATFAADGSVLTITLTAPLADDATGSGSNDGLDYPLTITNRSGIADAAGNAVTFTDAELEDNGPEVFSDTADVGETTFTVVFNEAVQETSAETVGNYTYSAGAVTNAVLGADGRTVTLTVGTAVTSGATLATTVTDTDGQASAQTGYVLAP